MRTIVFILLAVSLSGCIDHKAEPPPAIEKESPKTEKFQKFLDQFPEVSLPLEIRGCGEAPDVDILNGPISYLFNKRPEYAYGKFALDEDRVAVITLSPADCLLPVLTTYRKDGSEIDSKVLAIGQCSEGRCYKCEELLLLNKNLTLNISDTMQTFECDEDDLPKGKPLTTEIIYKEGKIAASGRIELGEEKKKKQP